MAPGEQPLLCGSVHDGVKQTRQNERCPSINDFALYKCYARDHRAWPDGQVEFESKMKPQSSTMEEQIHLACLGLPIYRAYARAEKDANDLMGRHFDRLDGHYSLVHRQTGSFAEGFFDVVKSDVDWMLILNYPEEIITADWQEKMFKTVEHAPAHVKILIPVADVQTFQKTFPGISSFFELLIFREKEEAFISAESTRNLNSNDFLPGLMKDSKPSAPLEHPENDETSPAYCLRSQEFKNLTVDRVPALQCEGWPKAAREWIGRKRYWPADSLVKKISSCYFYLVPKASTCGDHEREWRLSFSFAEADLLQSFDDIQVRIYYVLRTLYVKHLKEKVKGTLSSYNIKTTFLYMLQDHLLDFWSEENTINIIRTFFDRLLLYLKEGFSPHYFIPKHNLLQNISRTKLDEAAKEIFMLKECLAVALNEIAKKGFLGMMPRFDLWTFKVMSRLTLELIKLPEDKAFSALTSQSKENIAYRKDIERKCFLDILDETARDIKQNPKTDRLVKTNLPLIIEGCQMVYATEKDGSKMAQWDPKLMDDEKMNYTILVWLELCRVALRGRKTKLITNTNVTIVKIEDNRVKIYSKLFHNMCSIVSDFLVSPNLNTKEEYEKLLDRIDGSLPSGIDGCLQEEDLSRVVFVFAGGTLHEVGP